MAFAFNKDRSRLDIGRKVASRGTDFDISDKVSLGFITLERTSDIVVLDFLLVVNDDISAGSDIITFDNSDFLPRANVYGVPLLFTQQSMFDAENTTSSAVESQLFMTTSGLSLVKGITYKSNYFNRLRGHFVYAAQ